MHSFIVCFGSQKTRLQTVNSLIVSILYGENGKKDFLTHFDPDLIILKPDPTISIKTVRDLKAKLKLKPYAAKSKIAILTSADLLTLQAQQALLKTLEEPTPRSFLILELNNPHQLLPTIRSRCQIINAPSLKPTPKRTDLKQAKAISKILQQGSPGDRLSCLRNFTSKAEAQKILKLLIYLLRKKMRQDPSWAFRVRLTQEAIENLDNNLNLRLTLEHFALNFPRKA